MNISLSSITKKHICSGAALVWLIAIQISVVYGFLRGPCETTTSPEVLMYAPLQQEPSHAVSLGNNTRNEEEEEEGKEGEQDHVRYENTPRAPWFIPPKKTDSSTARVFILESSKNPYQDAYGVKSSATGTVSELTSAMIKAICEREERSTTKGRTAACNKQIETTKCISCLDDGGGGGGGVWYSTVSQAGSAIGRRTLSDNDATNHKKNASTVVVLPSSTTVFRQIDFVVPAVGQDDKLLAFCDRLGKTVKRFKRETFNGHANQKLTMRLIVTEAKNSGLRTTRARKADLAKRAGLDSPKMVILHKVAPPTSQEKFNKAQVVNALFANACNTDDCMVIALDVDMDCLPGFLYNSMSFVESGSSVYFPVVWSMFNPETSKRVEDLFQKENPDYQLSRTSNHKGAWRSSGYGMYAMSGTDAHQFKLDESFVGWGGEDGNFFGRVREHRNVVRMKDTGITHLWHFKDCETAVLDDKKYRSCIGSASQTEGSPIGLYLAMQKLKNAAAKGEAQNVPGAKVGNQSSSSLP